MADRSEYFAGYYQRNKESMDKKTVEYYKKRGKEFKAPENRKYKDKVREQLASKDEGN